MATQVAIWSVTDPDVYPTVARGNLTRTDRFDAKVNEIMNLVNNHTTHPSFDRQTVTMNVGDTITLRDTNGVLSNYYNSVQNENYTATISGNDLILTIDATIQGIAEKYLKEACIDNKCTDGGNIIAMNPKTGDVLAMATYPSYNLNEPYTINNSPYHFNSINKRG